MYTYIQHTNTPTALSESTCPPWCTAHNGYDDGSENWHQSRDVEIHGFEFYVSTGTMTRARRSCSCEYSLPGRRVT